MIVSARKRHSPFFQRTRMAIPTSNILLTLLAVRLGHFTAQSVQLCPFSSESQCSCPLIGGGECMDALCHERLLPKARGIQPTASVKVLGNTNRRQCAFSNGRTSSQTSVLHQTPNGASSHLQPAQIVGSKQKGNIVIVVR